MIKMYKVDAISRQNKLYVLIQNGQRVGKRSMIETEFFRNFINNLKTTPISTFKIGEDSNTTAFT